LDLSGAMRALVGSVTRIQVEQNALKMIITTMVQRSLRNKEIRPRYRVAMIAYSDDVYDILPGIQTIDIVAKKGIPKLEPFNRRDTTKGLKIVKNILEQEIKSYNKHQPAPLVIHMTAGESTSADDPEPVVREIQNIVVEDGCVLLANLFISDDLKVSSAATDWRGYNHTDDLHNQYANRLLSMSSELPDLYQETMAELGYSINKGTVMMYPGVTPEFVQMAFVMSTASIGAGTGETKWEED
jgi:hypothetical protein